MKTNLQRLSLGMLLVPLAFFSGCDWFKSKRSATNGVEVTEGDVVLFQINGKPRITSKTLKNDIDQLMKDNPQLQAVLPLMENAEHDIFMGLVNQELVAHYIAENGIDKRAEYQDELARMMRQVKYLLNTKYFAAENPVEVTDEEVRAFYDKNKETMPGLMTSRGGVSAKGIPFAKDAEAKAFAQKAKGKDFATAAKEAGLSGKIRDFKAINKTSVGIDAGLRDKIAAIKKFPATEVIKAEGKFWVVNATGSEAAQYCSFEQAKPSLQQYVEKEKRTQEFDKSLNKLKEQYNISINEDYFKKKTEEKQPESPAQAEQPVAQEEAKAAPAPVETKAA